MKLNRQQVLVLAMVIVVGLTALGVGYALWNKYLYVEGTVETGYLEAEWFWPLDFPTCYERPSAKPWVADVEAWIDPVNDDILHFVINNGYPYYAAGCEVHYRYTGSVPVHGEQLIFTPGPGLTGCVDNNSDPATLDILCDQIRLLYYDGGISDQLHEGYTRAGSLLVEVNQEAGQGTAYTFEIGVQLNQFNESQWPITP
jgi:hypothetical protein